MAMPQPSRRTVETLTGVAVILLTLAFLFFGLSQRETLSGEGTYPIVAVFDNASGIAPGAEVRLSGVLIGSVKSMELDTETFYAEVTLDIDDSILLPADTSARVLSDGLLGGAYISLTPGGELSNLEAGAEIDQTQGSVNLIDLLARFIFSAAQTK